MIGAARVEALYAEIVAQLSAEETTSGSAL